MDFCSNFVLNLSFYPFVFAFYHLQQCLLINKSINFHTMNYSSHEHLRPIHHSFLNPSLSSSEKKYEFNKKIPHSDFFCSAQSSLTKEQESRLLIFSKKLQMNLKQFHHQNANQPKLRKNSFFKNEEINIKQTKKIVIIQQQANKTAGFSVDMLQSKSEEKPKSKFSQKKRSLVQKSVQKIPLICYPVDRINGFRKRIATFLQSQDSKNVEPFQHVYKRKRFRKGSKVQLFESKRKLKLETQPGDLGRVCFVVPSNLEGLQQRIIKKANSIYEASQAFKRSSFRGLPKHQEKGVKLRANLNSCKQIDGIGVERHNDSQISPWNGDTMSKFL